MGTEPCVSTSFVQDCGFIYVPNLVGDSLRLGGSRGRIALNTGAKTPVTSFYESYYSDLRNIRITSFSAVL